MELDKTETSGIFSFASSDAFAEKRERRLLIVLRSFMVVVFMGVLGTLPSLVADGNAFFFGAIMFGVLVVELLVYLALYVFALRGKASGVRAVLFGVWCVYGGAFPWFIRPDYDTEFSNSVMAAVIVGFLSLAIVGIASLEEWRRAQRWILALNIIFVVSSVASTLTLFGVGQVTVPHVTQIVVSGIFLVGISFFSRALIKDAEQLLLVSEISSKRDQMQREQMRVARDAAQQASVSKSQFLANMSHELRTPLTAIIGYVELIKEDADDDGTHQFDEDLDRVRDAAKHLHGLINDILDLSKIEAGKMEVATEKVDLARLLEQVEATATPLVAAKNNRLVVERELLPEFCVADEMKLKQVLLNLVSNAAKFTRDGQVTIRGAKIARKRQPWVCLEIEDTGIGISSDKLPKIFEVFEQADGTTTRKYGGSGLGLPISRRLCEMMGGTLTAASKPGRGSTFRVELPLGDVALLESLTQRS